MPIPIRPMRVMNRRAKAGQALRGGIPRKERRWGRFLEVEQLESRIVPALTTMFENGLLSVISDADDSIAITRGADSNVKINGLDPQTGGPVAASAVTQIGITGGPGQNRVDLSVVVPTSFSSLQFTTLDGGGDSDTLIGPDLSNSWFVTGANVGQLNPSVIGLAIDFSGVENLTGGSAADLFSYSGGASISGMIRGGADQLTLDAGSANLSISGDVFGEGDISLRGDDIEVAANVVISSRAIAGADPVDSPSAGNAGNIEFLGADITIGQGAKILAHVEAGSSFTPGAINLTAVDHEFPTPIISPSVQARASISATGALFMGSDISITTETNDFSVFDLTSIGMPFAAGAIEFLATVAPLVGVSVVESHSGITLNGSTAIEATGNVVVRANANSTAQIRTLGPVLAAIAYAKSVADADVLVDAGASIRAVGNVTVETITNNTVAVVAQEFLLTAKIPIDFVAAVTEAYSSSTVKVADGANIHADGDILVHARSVKSFSTAGSGGGRESILGAGAVVTISDTTTTAELSGAATAGANVSVKSEIQTLKNESAMVVNIGDGFFTPVTQEIQQKIDQSKIKDSLGLIWDAVKNWFSGIIRFISGPPSPSNPNSLTSKIKQKITDAWDKAQESFDKAKANFALAGAVTIANHSNTSKAKVGSTAVIKAGGNVQVVSDVLDTMETSAIAEVRQSSTGGDPTQRRTAAGIAVLVSFFENDSKATIDSNASVDARDDITVDAQTRIPFQTQWAEFDGVSAITNVLNRNLGVQNAFFTSWAQAASNAQDNAAAGSINVFSITNTTKATIGAGARINQDPNLQTPFQDVIVTACTDVETLNLSGVVQFFLSNIMTLNKNPFGTSGGKAGLGGSFLGIFRDNTTKAVIEDGALIRARNITVDAETIGRNVSLAVSGGKAGKLAINGVFSIVFGNNDTVASIGGGADIDATGSIKVKARDEIVNVNAVGGIGESHSVGFGVSIGVNYLSRKTAAFIGTAEGNPLGMSGVTIRGASVDIDAKQTGFNILAALAAAVVTDTPDMETGPDPLEGVSLPIMFGAQPLQNQTGIAVAGDVAINISSDTTLAYVRDNGTIDVAGDVTLSSTNDTNLISAAGAVAVSLSGEQTSTAIAGSFSSDALVSDTRAYISGATIAADQLDVNATFMGLIVSLTAGGAGAPKERGIAVAGSVSVNLILATTEAYVMGANLSLVGDSSVTANDRTQIWAVAGAAAYGGKAGVGIGIGVNLIGFSNQLDLVPNRPATTRAFIEDSFVTITGGMLEVSAEADNPTVDPRIIAITAGVGASGQQESGAGAGMVSVNIIKGVTEAFVKKSTITERSGDAAALGLDVHAKDDSWIISIGGAIAVGQRAGIGAAIGYNEIHSDIRAYLDDADVMLSGAVRVDAAARAIIATATFGVGIGLGSSGIGAAGSASINLITNTVDARIINGSDVTATGAIGVTASDNSLIVSVSGGGAYGGTGAVGISVSYNLIGNTLAAYVENSHLDSTGATVQVSAEDKALLIAISIGAAAGQQGALGGSVTVNSISNTIDAHVSDGSSIHSLGDMAVSASEFSVMAVFSGGIGISFGGAALGAAVAYNYMGGSFDPANPNVVDKNTTANNAITAYIAESDVDVGGNLVVSAGFEKPEVLPNPATVNLGVNTVPVPTPLTSALISVAVAGAGGDSFAFGGAITLNFIHNSVNAEISNTAAGKRVRAAGGISVLANDDSIIGSIAGSFAGSSQTAIGASISTNDIQNKVKAHISSALVESTGGSIEVAATSSSTIATNAVGGAASGNVAVSGSLTLNFVHNTLKAFVDGSESSVSAFGDVSLSAADSSLIISIAGQVSGAGSIAISASAASNVIANTVYAYIDDGSVDSRFGGVDLAAMSGATVISFAIAGSGAGTESDVGTIVLNFLRNDVEAYAANTAVVTAGGPISIFASNFNNATKTPLNPDGIDILTGAGSIAGATTNSVGASVATNDVQDKVLAFIHDSTVMSTAGGVAVTAASSRSILAGAVVGVIGVEGLTIAGAVSVNIIKNDTEAYIDGGANVAAAHDIDLRAQDTSTIRSLAGQAGGSGGGSIGAAAAYNQIGNKVRSFIDGSTVASSDGSITAKALSDATIETISAGLSASVIGVAGSVSINLIDNDVRAYIQDSSATAHENIYVLADAKSTIHGLGGTVAGGVVGIGGTAVVNVCTNTTKAFVKNSNVVARGLGAAMAVKKWDAGTGAETTEHIRGLAVIADSSEVLFVVTVTAGLGPPGAGSVGLGVNLAFNIVMDTSEAFVQDSQINNSTERGQSVIIRAHQETDIVSGGGVLGLGDAGVGVAVDTNIIANRTKSYITTVVPGHRSIVFAAGGVEVCAVAVEDVSTVVVGFGIGTYVGFAGAASAVSMSSHTLAFVQDSDVTSGQNLDVLATSRSSIDFKDGTVGGSAFVGLGVCIAVGLISNRTSAYMIGAVTHAAGSTLIRADSRENLGQPLTLVGSAGVGGLAGLAGAVAVMSTSTVTSAYVGDGARNSHVISDSGSVVVQANNVTSVHNAVGTLGVAAIVGVGIAVDVIIVKNTVDAHIGANTTVTAGRDVVVEATSARDLSSIVLAGGGGLFGGITGAVSVLTVGTGPESQGSGEVRSAEETVNGVVSQSAAGSIRDQVINTDPNDQIASTARSGITNNLFIVSLGEDPAVTGTTAYIGQGAVVTAGNTPAKSGMIKVNAQETISELRAVVGGVAIGVLGAGVGGSVAVITVASSTSAFVDDLATLAAGTTAGSDIVVRAEFVNSAEALAAGGQAGLIGALGAQVSIIHDTSSQLASIDRGVRITQADSVKIEAMGNRDLEVEAKGAAVGTVAAGASVGRITAGGSTVAFLGDQAQVGLPGSPTATVGSLSITADSVVSADSDELAVAAGIVSGAGNNAEAIISPTVQATIGNFVNVEVAHDVVVKTTSEATARADALGIAVSIIGSVGVSLATAVIDPDVLARIGIGSLIKAHGNITVAADHNQGAGAGADAEGDASGGSLLLGNGADVKAMSRATVDALVSPNATLASDQTITVRARSTNEADADASGLTIGLLVGVGAIEAFADAGADDQGNGHTSAMVMTGARLITPQAPVGRNGNNALVEAIGNDIASSEAQASGGGLLSGNGANAETKVTPVVTASINDFAVVVVGGDFTVNAESHPEARSNAKGVQAGAIVLGLSLAESRLDPRVTARVGRHAYVNANGDIRITATYGNSTGTLPNPLFDPRQISNDTIFIVGHALNDDDIVTYVPTEGANPIDGLEEERNYNVIRVDADRIMLGDTFEPARGDAPSDFDVINFGNDGDRGRFNDTHDFETGDQVVYDPAGNAPIRFFDPHGNTISPDPATGQFTFYVRDVDGTSIKLAQTKNDATREPQRKFNPSDNLTFITPADNTRPGFWAFTSGDPFNTGDAVTYRAPAPKNFADTDVDDDQDNRIHIKDHGFTTGDAVIYRAFSKPISPLVDGGKYYVIKWNDSRISLAETHALAVFNIPIAIQDVDPNDLSHHTLSLEPIRGLQDGRTYYAIKHSNFFTGDDLSGDKYLLANTRGDALNYSLYYQFLRVNLSIPVFPTGAQGDPIVGKHSIGFEGVDFDATGVIGRHRIRFHLDPPDTIKQGSIYLLIGSGEGEDVEGGDGSATAKAKGSIGAALLFGEQNSEAKAKINPVVLAQIDDDASVSTGTVPTCGLGSPLGSVTVSSKSLGLSRSTISNTTGAFVGIGGASTTANVINSSTVSLGAGASIQAGDVTMHASSFEFADTKAKAKGSAVIAISDADAEVTTTRMTRVLVGAGASIQATGNLTLVAGGDGSGTLANALARANSAGLGAGSTSQATVHMGGANWVGIAAGATLVGDNVVLDASVPILIARADAKAKAGGLGGSAESKSKVDLDDDPLLDLANPQIHGGAVVSVAGGATVQGNTSLTLKASHDRITTWSRAYSKCNCFGGDTSPTAINNQVTWSKIYTQAGSQIRTLNLDVSATTEVESFATKAKRKGALLDFGSSDEDKLLTPVRTIDFNADVVILGDHVELVVDQGNNLVVTTNASIHDMDRDPEVAPGFVNFQHVVVNDLPEGSRHGSARFSTNALNNIPNLLARDLGGYFRDRTTGALIHQGDVKDIVIDGFADIGKEQDTVSGLVWSSESTSPSFSYHMSLEAVTVINSSSKDLILNDISAHAVQLTPSFNTGDPGAILGGIFKNVPTFAAVDNSTCVMIENTSTSDILLYGTVDNPSGSTEILNRGGSILVGEDPSADLSFFKNPFRAQVLVSNTLNIAAPQGHIGTPSRPVYMELVQSAGRPTLLESSALDDINIRMRNDLREDVATSTIYIGDLISDQGDANITVLSALSGPIPVNTNVVLGIVQTGGNIVINAFPGPTTISVAGFTNILSDGHIDVSTNGDIRLTETMGDMRVGNIISTTSNVVLTAPTSIVDALNEPEADVTGRNITLTAGTAGGGEIGASLNFLEINSSSSGFGVLTALAPNNVFIEEVAGDLNVEVVKSNSGSAWLISDGSIVDGMADAGADVLGNTITLQSQQGLIGSANDDLEIDSALSAAGVLISSAEQDIYITETNRDLKVFLAEGAMGEVRLTVPDSASAGQDLHVVEAGQVTAAGAILLRVGDSIATTASSLIRAGTTIDLFGDYLNADAGIGTLIDLRGEITPGAGENDRTSIFGNTDDDSFNFNQTRLGGQTFAYGSPSSTTMLADDGQDVFVVNQLPTMNTVRPFTTPQGVITRRDTLDLDGQADTDTYTVNTTGSQGGAVGGVANVSDYLINVLDSGASDDGVDMLTVNGASDPDVFLLRRADRLIGRENAETPAFVALLHGTLDQVRDQVLPQVERISYDQSVNGRVVVNGLGGDDVMASDDNGAITTLDGGAGDDTFQIGQVFGTSRMSPDVAPEDEFGTIETTRGFLSPGISFPMLIYGGTGNDSFTVYSNQAELRLEGNDGNDAFLVQAFALADQSGFSTKDKTQLNTGTGNDTIQYNINAPVSIDGGAGFDKLIVLGTEFSDNFAITDKSVSGAGLSMTYENVESVVVDGLESDDHFFVLSTKRRVTTTILGNFGSDTFDITGDVSGRIVARDLEGRSGVIDHSVVSAQDARYDGESGGGIELHVADPSQGQVVVAESMGSTVVAERGETVDDYDISLVRAPSAPVYITVSAASAASEEAGALPPADTVLVSTDNVNFFPALVVTLDAMRMNARVFVKAVDDSAEEGVRFVMVSLSTVSDDATFNHVSVRNVQAKVLDDDKPGLIITETSGGTLVLEGAAPLGITDTYTVALAKLPAAGQTVTVTLGVDDTRLMLSSNDPRFATGPNGVQTITFNDLNWDLPVTIDVSASDPAHLPQNRTSAEITHAVASTDPTFVVVEPTAMDVDLVDADSAGVLVTESDGSTLVIKNGPGDTYDIRLTMAPAGPVFVHLHLDGQVLVSSQDTRFDFAAESVRFDVNDWFMPATIHLSANTDFVPPVGHEFDKSFPIQAHTTNRIRGPLGIEGFSGMEPSRGVNDAVILPMEVDPGPLSGGDPRGDEAIQIDRLNVFNDMSVQPDSGNLTGSSLSGLEMAQDLTLNVGTDRNPLFVTIPGGITYHDVEVLDVLLGRNDDTFTVESTLTTTAVHGGITAVHGGGGSDHFTIAGGGGPTSPLVVFGDTSQDGSDYDDIPGVPGTTGRRFKNPGNDFLDARNDNSGVALYGGLGEDLIYGSQAGDHLAGGAGDDEIHGQADDDHIYGDSGFNADLATRILTVATANTSNAWNADVLAAGSDALFGDAGNDLILGDHGVISQTAGTLRILTTGSVTRIETTQELNGVSDAIDGGIGDDYILAGLGDDDIFDPQGRNIVFGDFGFIDRVLDDGNLADIDRIGTNGPLVGGSDSITTGADSDMIFGGLGGDHINAGDGPNNIVFGDNGMISSAFTVNATPDLAQPLDGHPITLGRFESLIPNLGGDDMITTGVGRDIVLGGFGNDRITANAGEIAGMRLDGNNLVLGDNGAIDYVSMDRDPRDVDQVSSPAGDLYGGNDVIATGVANDLIIAGPGSDQITSGDGLSVVFADSGQITSATGYNPSAPFSIHPLQLGRLKTIQSPADGNDVLAFGAANDIIFGGAGDDIIYAGGGNDLVFGAYGEVFGRDSVPLDPQAQLPPLAIGQLIFTSIDAQNSDLHGLPDNDLIYGQDGDDVILGEQGNDTAYGGAGADDLIGGGNVIGAQDGDDILDGGAGGDVIAGDNADIYRRGNTLSPRFRAVAGTALYDSGGRDLVTETFQADPGGDLHRTITLLDHSDSPLPETHGDDYMAGGAGNDELFGQLGDDVIQGDNSVDGLRVSATRLANGTLFVAPSVLAPTDGDDYIEGNGGGDVVFGNGGQDDILGGSSNFFSLTKHDQRPDGSDLIFGGSGTAISRNTYGDASDNRHASDSDMILGDNGDIMRIVGINGTPNSPAAYQTFNYDQTSAFENRGTVRIVVRAARLLDYTPGGPDFNAAAAATDIGGNDEIHGESGDDFAYGEKGNDVMFGEAQDDDLVGNYGNDWISGGSGDDGILGDDGRIFTSRNSATIPEPLYGIGAFVATDPDTRRINGNVLNEVINTPGTIQLATINVAGQLKKTVDLTPFSVDTTWVGLSDEQAFKATNDDMIFGGLGNDTAHGGSGDDALSGGEALPESYTQTQDANLNVTGLAQSDYYHPFNPGDALRFNPTDPNSRHSGLAGRTGEFALYDEFDPMRRILLNYDGTLNKTGTGKEFFLNFLSTEGPLDTRWDLTGATQKPTDGDDALFGDNGNDWMVGGTGRDNMYGGWGNDLLNADDDLNTNNGANDLPDGDHGVGQGSYEDRAYGGAGKDVLIANTGGDRLIDWVGEFNSYLVPFATFGMPTVSRTRQPALDQFLYALSLSDGVDPTRLVDALASGFTGTDTSQNGEPFGELGLVDQHDAAWRSQTGSPSDPQAGNTPGGRRDVIRSANYSPGNSTGFIAANGAWSLGGGAYQNSLTPGDALALFYFDSWLPSYYEVTGTFKMSTAGARQNAFIIFDYQSPTDFKYAGLDATADLLRIGQRTAAAWIDKATVCNNLQPNSNFTPLLAVNGSTATLTLGKSTLSYTFSDPLNDGMIGVGAYDAVMSNSSLTVQKLPKVFTYQIAEDFSDGIADKFTPQTGTWIATSGSQGRYTGTPSAAEPAISARQLVVEPLSYVEYSATVRAITNGASAGLAFAYSDSNNFLYAAVAAGSNQVVLGHRSGGVWFTDVVAGTTITAGTDYTLLVALDKLNVNVVLNGRSIAQFDYNFLVHDGQVGLMARDGAASFDNLQVRGDDAAYAGGGTPLLAAGLPARSFAASQTVAVDQLMPIVWAAIQRWETTDPSAGPILNNVAFTVLDLPGHALANTIGHSILLDSTAAGFGWFVDWTPLGDSEFAGDMADGVHSAAPPSPAQGRMDLLTVVMHELGHVLGQEDLGDAAHSQHDLMAATLPPGTRRLPEGLPFLGTGVKRQESLHALRGGQVPGQRQPTEAFLVDVFSGQYLFKADEIRASGRSMDSTTRSASDLLFEALGLRTESISWQRRNTHNDPIPEVFRARFVPQYGSKIVDLLFETWQLPPFFPRNDSLSGLFPHGDDNGE